jgi:putative ABC transport system permease protein
VLARLGPDVSLEAARGRLTVLGEALEAERPRGQGWALGLSPLERRLGKGVRNGFFTLGAAVFFLLLIACANAAGLLFLRGVSRRPEFALRAALGGSRRSLVGHVLAESVLLAVAAGALGTLMAWAAVRGMVALLPSTLVRFSYNTVGIDGRVLGFAFALTACTGLVFGVLPALRSSEAPAARAGYAATASRREVRMRAVVQVGQLALAVVLLAGAGLFGRSFAALSSVPAGFEVDELLRLQLVPLERLRGDREATVAFARELDERLRALPGVVGVSRSGGVGLRFGYTIELDDGDVREAGEDILPHLSVGAGYFDVLGIPLLEGRPFRPDEAGVGSDAVIVERDFAEALWPGRSAVGRSFRIGEDDPVTVVGVTDDVKLEGPHDPYGPYMLFYPSDVERLRSGTVHIRTTRDPRSLIPTVRALVREMDPEQPVASIETGRDALGETVADPRFVLVMMVAFASVAVVLAAIGVYGLVSFTVVQRTREIGVRRALGARASRVVSDVVGWGFLLGLAGAGLGLAVAASLARFVSALLFGVSPLDPAALALAVLTLLAACVSALVLPALRAARVPPSEALRVE